MTLTSGPRFSKIHHRCQKTQIFDSSNSKYLTERMLLNIRCLKLASLTQTVSTQHIQTPQTLYILYRKVVTIYQLIEPKSIVQYGLKAYATPVYKCNHSFDNSNIVSANVVFPILSSFLALKKTTRTSVSLALCELLGWAAAPWGAGSFRGGYRRWLGLFSWWTVVLGPLWHVVLVDAVVLAQVWLDGGLSGTVPMSSC